MERHAWVWSMLRLLENKYIEIVFHLGFFGNFIEHGIKIHGFFFDFKNLIFFFINTEGFFFVFKNMIFFTNANAVKG